MILNFRKLAELSIDSTVGNILDQINRQNSYATGRDGKVDYRQVPKIAINTEMLPESIRALRPADIVYIKGEDLQAIVSIPYLLEQKEITQISDLWRIRLIMLQFVRILQTENLGQKVTQLSKFSVILDEKEGLFLVPAALAPTDRI